MNSLPHVLYFTLLLDSGPGTPAGTTYSIAWRVSGEKKTHAFISSATSFNLWLPPEHKVFFLTVQASCNNTTSKKSKVTFDPFTQTVIGPPKVSLSGCGNCIHINISLPEADPRSGIKDIKSFYKGAQFKVNWKKRNGAEQSGFTKSKNYTVNNLQIGTEYCVQVSTKINVNRNTKSSDWECIFTGNGKPSAGPVFSGAVAALVIISGVLMISMFFLYYTGFLCNGTTLPRALTKSLSQGYALTPERTYPNKICIGAEMEKPRNDSNRSAPQAASRGTNSDEDEEDEEEDGGNVYMDRDAELSSDESSCQDSADVPRNSKGSELGGSGSLKVQDKEFEFEVKHWDLNENPGQAEGTDVSYLPERPVTVKLKEEEKKKEEEEEDMVCKSHGDINLFSVTLAALAACEEGDEEQNTRDCISDILLNLEPLSPTKSEQSLSHTDSQRENPGINATYTRRMYP